MHEALKLIRKKVLTVMKNLRDFAIKYKDLDTLGSVSYTHLEDIREFIKKHLTL